MSKRLLDLDLSYITNEQGQSILNMRKVMKLDTEYGESIHVSGWVPVPVGRVLSQEEAERLAAEQQQPAEPEVNG
jgi:hypothetical protein